MLFSHLLTLCLLSLAFGPTAMADNSYLTSLWNQKEAGQYCLQTREKDVKAAGSCRQAYKNNLDALLESANSFIERDVFNSAVPKQIKKDKCLIERLNQLNKPSEMQDAWIGNLVEAWIGMRKAVLIREKCMWHYLEKTEGCQRCKTQVCEGQLCVNEPEDKVYAASADKPWRSVCTDKAQMGALNNAEELYAMALPVVSSKKYLKIVEKFRDRIVNSKTKKALSDEDILAMDVTKLDNVELNIDMGYGGGRFRHLVPNNEFREALNEFTNDLRDERKESLEETAKAKMPDGTYDLSQDQKDYIYEDGTVYPVLLERGLISKETAANPALVDTPLFGQHFVSNGISCMISTYEPNGQGEIFDFAATTFGTAGFGVFFKVKKFANMSRAKKVFKAIASSTKMGLMVAGGKMLLNAGAGCFARNPGLQKAASNQEKSSYAEAQFLPRSDNAPKSLSLNYQAKTIEFDQKTTPSCSGTENLSLPSMATSNCIVEMGKALLPIGLSLGAEGLQSALED
jgi:hypothetical protein